MIKKVYSAAVLGLSAELVEVETDLSSGLPATVVVGLPDAAIRESRERVKSALKHSSVKFPQARVAINLAPADLPKIGTHYDLPIAVSVLLNSGQIDFDPKQKMFLGELALDGALRPVPGVLVIAEFARKCGFRVLFVPEENALEASLVEGLKVVSVRNLTELLSMLAGFAPLRVFIRSEDETGQEGGGRMESWDFKYVRGQELAKLALEIAAAGGHNVLLKGPPGSGKTLLARALASVLPELGYGESLEVTKIYSVTGLLRTQSGLVNKRPFRAPHHTSSSVALVGGGSKPKPGEVTLAHRGVLFLDEFPEFSRSVLEGLRQPLEDGLINVARAAGTLTFPAEFMLVAAQNPCPCGFAGDPDKICSCTTTQLLKYKKRVSGPLLDRIDLHVEVPRLSFEKIEDETDAESSRAVRARVKRARAVQKKRFRKNRLKIQTNAEMGVKEIKKFCQLDQTGRGVLRAAVSQFHLSARAYHRILKVSRTIADMSESGEIEKGHVEQALMFRPEEEKEGNF